MTLYAGMVHLPIETVYRGHRRGATGAIIVTCEWHGVIQRILEPSKPPKMHNSNGFEWGFVGAGPRELAHALLLDFTHDESTAGMLFHQFMRDYVSGWNEPAWSLSGAEIEAWLFRMREKVSDLLDE